MKKVQKDSIFKNDLGEKFSFSKEVASVFDDMLPRSVPYYNDNIALIAELVAGRSAICDLGCSTGNLLLFLARNLDCETLCGVDNSAPMLEIARAKASAYSAKIEFINENILDFDFKILRKDSRESAQISSKKDKFDAIIANYTMQFIRPQKRESLCKKIHKHLQKNGIFIMSEKLLSEDKWLDKRLIDIYHAFKAKNGYSKTEISKKREALENILIPFSQNENIAMLENAGFRAVEVVFRFCNFATFIALKGE